MHISEWGFQGGREFIRALVAYSEAEMGIKELGAWIMSIAFTDSRDEMLI